MLSLSEIKEEKLFIEDMEGIIDTFKMTALIQFRLFQQKEKVNRLFFSEIESAFDLLSGRDISSKYFAQDLKLPKVLILITSDEGFLGELNSLIINSALDKRQSSNDIIIVLGSQGAKYLEEMKITFLALPGISENVDVKEAEKLSNYLLREYNQQKFGQVQVIYPEFVSLTTQRISTFNLLPYYSSSQRKPIRRKEAEDILIDPSGTRIAEGLISLWMNFKFLEIFWSAKQSEYAARIMHLESSTEELAELNRKVTFLYFKRVHALSDKTIREVSATKLLLKKRKL